MKCAGHNNQDAVGTCNSCGRGLCAQCISVFSPPICGDCALAHNREIAKSLWLQLVLMAAMFGAALVVFIGKLPWVDALGYAVMAGFFVPGWNFLGRYFSPSGNYLFPTARWINLIVHAAVAAFIGVVVGPIYLFKAWKEMKTVGETKKLMG